ncbi:MAG: RNA polymerase sigma factor [Isosphaerales bacterium]
MERIGPDILGRLFDEHAGALLLFARQWCDAPDDIVQDAFVALARQKAMPERVVPWLYRVVRNGAISAARQLRRRRRREERVAGKEAARGESWFAATDDRIDAEHASRLLADLDRETREIIVARLWGGLTFEEIAHLQGCSLSTAHRRYQDGLTRLQARLEKRWTATTQSATAKSNANST